MTFSGPFSPTASVQPDTLVPGLTGPLDRPGAAAFKRALDIGLTLPLLLLALPILVGSGVAIILVDGGPIFYTQVRLGRHGRPFRLWKMRTMVRNAERVLARSLMEDPVLRTEWDATCKLIHDPRILPYVGTLLRRFAIDELPQLWNVLRGDLSLVGPRPLPAYHARLLGPGTRTLRRTVRPGLTGLWQVERRDRSMAEMERLDLAYLEGWTPLLDIGLLGRTALVLSNGRHCL